MSIHTRAHTHSYVKALFVYWSFFCAELARNLNMQKSVYDHKRADGFDSILGLLLDKNGAGVNLEFLRLKPYIYKEKNS